MPLSRGDCARQRRRRTPLPRWQRRQHTSAGILKNNLRSDNKSGRQLDWTYPINRILKGHIQGYTGYGENLIDGDRYTNRIGVGPMLADWF